MTSKPVVTSPRGPLRWALRLPVGLYRLRLGWLLGERFVLLRHVGRKTGQSRQTVVEVIGHDRASDTYYIVSGWGPKADWYQNLLATPHITIQVGRRTLAVLAERVPAEEGARIFLDYRQKHAFAARELSRALGLDFIGASPQELEAFAHERLPVLALRPAAGGPASPGARRPS